MEHTNGQFTGAGGVEIFWQAWKPAAPPRAVVTLAHGMSEHSGRYAWTGQRLAARGYALYALDHRGHGRSSGSRSYIDHLDRALGDITTLRGIAKDAHPETGEPMLMGH